jgi:predicted nucleotidyltransferase
MEFDIRERTILEVRHGSHAYGTNIEGSDLDIKGVCIPPKEYYLGFYKRFEQQVSKDPNDVVIFALDKFVKHAADCNPNFLEVLFVDPSDIVYSNMFGNILRDMRGMFLSRKAKHTFSGYAHSQLKRIKTHRAWLLNPPLKDPKREDFGLPNERQVSKSEMGAFLQVEEKKLLEGSGVSEGVIELLQREKAYGNAKREWEQYQGWKRERNPTRAALEAKHGFDTKHAGHMFRLGRMCKEILLEGVVRVKRPDAAEIVAIRNGVWSYEQLIAEFEVLEAECEEAYKVSTLPKSVDVAAIDALIVGLTEEYLRLYD